jgi:CHAT domain-containing protein
LKNYDVADTLWNKAISNYLYEIKTYFPKRSEREKETFYKLISHELDTYNSYALQRMSTNPNVLSRMYDNQLATKALLLNSSNKVRHRILSSKDSSLVKMYREWNMQKEILSKAYSLSLEEIKKQNINIDSLTHVANELEKKLTEKSELFKTKEKTEFRTWKDIQKVLHSGEAAMEIIRFTKYKFDSAGVYTDSVYYAALIVKHNTRDHPELVLMTNGNKMENKHLIIYKNTVRFKIEDLASYNYYWRNISEKLVEVKKLYLSPDGVYNQININTLTNADTKKHVLDEVDVQLVTNTKDLLEKKEDENSKKQFAFFGNPDYAFMNALAANSEATLGSKEKYGHYLNQLPGTEREINSINKDLTDHRWQGKVYVGPEASEKNLKKVSNVKVIHIATHGFFDKDEEMAKTEEQIQKQTQDPLFKSGLMLTGASVTLYNREHNIFATDNLQTKEEDGILTAFEVLNLNLDNTDLVVLSACETGLGKVKNGEGVYGLQRAFIIAGAESIIISLWKVDDATTQKLMTYFYHEWLKTNNKSLAFKRAQVKLREEFEDPYYWGAFIMVQ